MTTQCEKCNRSLTDKTMQQHKEFCEKVPPPDELKKYRNMSFRLMSDMFGVADSNLRKHFKIIGVIQKKGKACRKCGLIVGNQLGNNHKICRHISQHFTGITAMQKRDELQRMIDNSPNWHELAEFFDVSKEGFRKHIYKLLLTIPTRNEKRQKKYSKSLQEKIDAIDIPRHHMELLLQYYGMAKLGRYLGNISVPLVTKILIKLSIDIPSTHTKSTNRRVYKKKHGAFPCLDTIVKHGKLVPEETPNQCPICEMNIYDENELRFLPLLPPNAEVRREQPSRINQWTQEAIELERNGVARSKRKVDGKPLWYWKKINKKHVLFTKNYNGYDAVGEGKYCRFCVADLLHKDPPTPPDWALIN